MNKRFGFECLLSRLFAWLARRSQRRALADLEEFRLPDLGISEMERRKEVAKWR